MTPDGYTTLDQLRNAPPGRVFQERRYQPIDGLTLAGVPARTENRANANATIAQMRARILELELQARLGAVGIEPTP